MPNYVRKDSDNLSDYESNQTVIINEKFLNSIWGTNTKVHCEWTEPISEWYPLSNSFYAFTEDVDVCSRVNYLKSMMKEFKSSKKATGGQPCLCATDEYSEKLAQAQYLSSKPTSFLILGKPGIGQEQLGKLLSEYWNCVYMEPETLIEDEIAGDTETGRCLEYNLRNGRPIGPDAVLKLLKKRVNSKTSQHRGFVVCGFPLIPNDLYEEERLTCESTLANVQSVCRDIFDTAVELGVPPPTKSAVLHVQLPGEWHEEEPGLEAFGEGGDEPPIFREDEGRRTPIDLGDPISHVCLSGQYDRNYEEQLHFVFSLFEQPFVIIYPVCSNADVIVKRQNQKFDINSQREVNSLLEDAGKNVYTIYSQARGNYNDEVPEDFIDIIKSSDAAYNNSERPGQTVLLPKDWVDGIVITLNCYRKDALPVVENYVLKHDLENYIRVDGRISPMRMLHAVKQRLSVLPLQKVLIPQRFSEDSENTVEGQSSGNVNFEGMSMEECLELLVSKHAPSALFKWKLSDFGFKCPVHLKDGVEKNGDPNYAVHFMNKIYFLSDEDCYYAFKRNPRPFLSALRPMPNYKICVMGHRSSGKSTVSKFLGYLLDCEVIEYQNALDDTFQAKIKYYENDIRSKAMEHALEISNAKLVSEWTEKRNAASAKISEWMVEQRYRLSEIIQLKKTVESYLKSVTVIQISSFPSQLSYRTGHDDDNFDERLDDPKMKNLASTLQDMLKRTNFPQHLTIEDFEDLLTNDEKICKYLPEELIVDNAPTLATPEDQFVCDYVEQALEAASFTVEVTIDHKTEVLLERIKKVETELECAGRWIIDGMLPDSTLFNALYPDDTPIVVILLKDEQLRCPFKGHDDYVNFKRLFYEIRREEAAWRTPFDTSNYVVRNVGLLLEDLVDRTVHTADGTDVKMISLEKYKNDAKEFDKEFDAVRSLLVEQNVELISVDISEKSMEALLKDVAKLIEGRYAQTASIFTEADKLRELEDTIDVDMRTEEETEEEKLDDDRTELGNRQYGDTYYYCPVIYGDHFALWKGKDEYTVKFDNKLYLMSGENAMNKFLADPLAYANFERPPDAIPPPRICVVGQYGSGKVTLADTLSKNLGLYNYVYDNMLKKLVAPTSRMCLHELLTLGLGEPEAANVTNYLLRDKPLDESILRRLVDPLWTDRNRKKFGFVLSGFPRRVSDVDYMIKHGLIPDIVIQLSISANDVRSRMIAKRLLELNKLSQSQRRQEIMEHWGQQYERRFRELVKQESAGIDASPHEEIVAKVQDLLASELPKPEFSKEIFDQTTDAYLNDLVRQSEEETMFLNSVRDACDIESIPWVTVDAGLDKERVFVQTMRAVEIYKLRNRSFLETVQEVSEELSEKLLSTGYYFLSKFGRMCPVQVYESVNPVQMYLPQKEKFRLYPLAYRQYLYYIAKQKDVDKFKRDPLKYVNQKNTRNSVLPLKIAVIGPPKSGKTVVAERFKRDLGVQVITRGRSCRYVLNYLGFSEIAEQMRAVLRNGQQLTDDIVMKAVEACTFDGRCSAQGFVFDGFPVSMEETRELAAMGLIPHLIIDLNVDRPTLRMMCQSVVGRRNMPAYSEQLIDHRYDTYRLSADRFRQFADKEYQNLAVVNVTTGKWGVWTACLNLTLATFSEIKFYHRHAYGGIALRLSYMLITPWEFIQRQSSYKQYCPCCLFFDDALRSGGKPPDRTGLVQFREHFYYLCNDHVETFVKEPEKFVAPYNTKQLPRDLPARAKKIGDVFYAHGNCVVCFWDNQPNHVIKPGRETFAVAYRDKVYLFDQKSCAVKFMEKPHVYFAIEINYVDDNAETVSLKDLPLPGFLQQQDVLMLSRALVNTSILRPVIPGLDVATSACLNVGLHLAVNNPRIDEKCRSVYKEGEAKFHRRRLKLIDYLDQMKKITNPHLHYEESVPKFIDPLFGGASRSSTARGVIKENPVTENDADSSSESF